VRRAIAIIAIVSATCCLLALSGCGGNNGTNATKTATPEQTARTTLDLVLAGKLAEAGEHFTERDSMKLLTMYLGGETVVRVGVPVFSDPRSARVDLFTDSHSLASISLTMIESGGVWKITQVTPQ
jgi:hypothetical protein